MVVPPFKAKLMLRLWLLSVGTLPPCISCPTVFYIYVCFYCCEALCDVSALERFFMNKVSYLFTYGSPNRDLSRPFASDTDAQGEHVCFCTRRSGLSINRDVYLCARRTVSKTHSRGGIFAISAPDLQHVRRVASDVL